jgi:hypothetical protein
MGSNGRRRSVLFGVLLGLAAMLLAALPALGLRLSPTTGDDRAVQPTKSQADRLLMTSVHISGRVQQVLSPGVSSPIFLTFRNDSSKRVQMQRVRAKIRRIVAPNATAAHPCTRLDFEIRQMRKGRLRIPRGTSDLSSLGLPLGSWPTLAMRNRPLNQDGCKGVRVVLRLHARRVAR